MPIFYALVARANTVLAEHTSRTGNFPTITRTLLNKISDQDQRKSYQYDSHVFNIVVSDGLTFLCLTDDARKRRIPFMFLEAIRRQFTQDYGARAMSAHAFAMNTEFSRVLRSQMERFNNDGEVDGFSRVQDNLAQVKDVMVQNIERVLERGEKIDLLVEKTHTLQQTAKKFQYSSNTLKNKMWWQKCRMTTMIVIVVLILIWFILSLACGFDFHRCAHHKSD